MYNIEDIKKYRLDESICYSVRDSTRCKFFNCRLAFQADFIFLFVIADVKVPDNKICISKVDYFLNNNIVLDVKTRQSRMKLND